jgi:hypothetical protein
MFNKYFGKKIPLRMEGSTAPVNPLEDGVNVSSYGLYLADNNPHLVLNLSLLK